MQIIDAAKLRSEQTQLDAAYGAVLAHPTKGNAEDILAVIEHEEIGRILIHRGPAIESDGGIVVVGRMIKNAGGAKRGFGLTKVIYRHGEKFNKNKKMPAVSRADVLSLPQILREYAPSEQKGGTSEDGATRWDIPRDDGYCHVVVIGRGQDGPDARLVTMYIDKI